MLRELPICLKFLAIFLTILTHFGAAVVWNFRLGVVEAPFSSEQGLECALKHVQEDLTDFFLVLALVDDQSSVELLGLLLFLFLPRSTFGVLLNDFDC